MQKNQNVGLNVSGKSVEEAIALGLEQLGVSREQVNIEVVNEGKRGIFGLGSEEALVRLTVKPDPMVEPQSEDVEPVVATPQAETSAPASLESPPSEDTDEPSAEIDASDQTDVSDQIEESEVARLATGHLEGLLRLMGIKAEVVVRTEPELSDPGEEPPLVLDVVGDDLGILIGRRSETLQSLQFMVRLMVNKDLGRWQHLLIDVESYRSRRRQSLQRLAKQMAERAVANGERVVLEAMPSYERRLIHIALRDHPEVYTTSVGRDNNRKVTINPK